MSSSTLKKLALRRETVRNLGVKSSLRAGAVGGITDTAANQSTSIPVPKSSGGVGPHSIDTGGLGGGIPGWVPR